MILIRQRDKLEKEGPIHFVEFNRSGRGKDIHKEPKEGYACIVGNLNSTYTWLTTPITEVISNTEFKTKNSHYIIKE